MSQRIEEVRAEASELLSMIGKLFKPGAKLTVLVRFDGFPDRDFCLTNDDLGEVIAMIERRREAEPQ